MSSFGTPTWSNQNEVAFAGYDYIGGIGYTVVVPCLSPVRSLVISVQAGIDWDMRGELQTCKSLLPMPAAYERAGGGNYYYATVRGEVAMTAVPNQCSLIFTTEV